MIEKTRPASDPQPMPPALRIIEPVTRTRGPGHIRAFATATTVSLALTVILGLALRFWHINALGYNSDEAVYTGQAAALAGDPRLSALFPIFRAHPMVFQYTLSLAFSLFGVHDIIGRSLVAVLGILTVLLTWRAASDLYGRWAGITAAAIMAVMPYHVIVTRQVLLDGPLTFCTTLTLVLLVRYASTTRPVYLMGVGAGLGLTFLTKETGFVLAAATFAFLALCPEIRIRFWPLVGAGISMMIPMLMFPVSLALAGRSDTAQSYLIWQLLRRSNHAWTFFPTVVPPALGWLVVLAAGSGLVLLRKTRTWRETLLLCWIAVPTVVFQFWPVKGYQYLLPIAPAVAILAARTITLWRPRTRFRLLSFPAMNAIAGVLMLVSLAVPSWQAVGSVGTTSRMAGAGGLPGVRETGKWIDANLPENAVLVTIGPSMANMIQFYGNRKAYGLSVSTNPLHRNPSYEPLENPDAALRYGDAQYLVYDSFSASRSSFFLDSLNRYIEKYDAREVYAFAVPTPDHPDGARIIVIYEVRP